MAKRKSTYAQKLLDPRWQKLRLQVMERDGWQCQGCGAKEKSLSVHHGFYETGKEPWEYPIWSLCTYCEDCHKQADGLRKHTNRIIGCLNLNSHADVAALLSLIGKLYYADGPKANVAVGDVIQLFTQLLSDSKEAKNDASEPNPCASN